MHEEPFNDITLKQFRDVEDPQAACFQVIVQARIVIEQIFEMSEIEEPLEVSIHHYASQPIAEILGLKPKAQKRGAGGMGRVIDIFQAIRPFWVTAALKKGLGKNLCWRAGTDWQKEPEDPNQSPHFQKEGETEEGDTKVGQALVKMIDDQYASAASESPQHPQSLRAMAHDWEEDHRLTRSEGRQALEQIDPQMGIESILSREWEKWGDARWRRMQRGEEIEQKPNFCVHSGAVGPAEETQSFLRKHGLRACDVNWWEWDG